MSYWPKSGKMYPVPFVFIHIPKTAGISIQQWYRKTYGKFHKCMHGDVRHPNIKQEMQYSDSFCVVRNPYDLVSSWYRYKRQMLQEPRHWDQEELEAWRKGFDYWLPAYIDKINYTRDKTTGGYNPISPSRCQLDYITEDGEIKVTHILKFETLNEDIKQINAITGKDVQLPHRNKTEVQFRDYRKVYTKKTRKLVEKYYEKDLNQFDYEF